MGVDFQDLERLRHGAYCLLVVRPDASSAKRRAGRRRGPSSAQVRLRKAEAESTAAKVRHTVYKGHREEVGHGPRQAVPASGAVVIEAVPCRQQAAVVNVYAKDEEHRRLRLSKQIVDEVRDPFEALSLVRGPHS